MAMTSSAAFLARATSAGFSGLISVRIDSFFDHFLLKSFSIISSLFQLCSCCSFVDILTISCIEIKLKNIKSKNLYIVVFISIRIQLNKSICRFPFEKSLIIQIWRKPFFYLFNVHLLSFSIIYDLIF
jgi:hypothetical protein